MGLSSLNRLYMTLITEHSKHPHHFGQLEGVKAVQLNNPTCGDVISLTVQVTEGVITDIAFSGHGCAISTASASMMTDAVLNKTIKEAQDLGLLFSDMVQGQSDGSVDELGDAAMMAGVAQFPQRIKCATLSWNALKEALAHANNLKSLD